MVAAFFAMASCAGAPRFDPTAPVEGQIEELRAWFEEDEGDVDGRVDYGRALLEAGDHDAVLALTGPDAPEDHQADPRVRVLRGIALEEMDDLQGAETVYVALLEDPAARAFRADVEARLVYVRDRLLQEAARDAIAREGELAAEIPPRTTLAVLPFRVASAQPDMDPLGRAFAELLVTDLALAERFDVLERVQVQALVDELNLSDAGLAEPRTAARSGRMLGAGNLVQGTLTLATERLRSDAAVVGVTAGAPEVDPLTHEDAAEAMMAIEAQLALDILAELGVQLTPAEEARILDRPQVRLEALLAFGRGLRAYDLGNLAEAEAQFQQAAELDPDFALARQRQVRMARGFRDRLPDLARAAVLRDRAMDALRLGTTGSRARILQMLGGGDRIPLVDALGSDVVQPQFLYLELVFTRPGG
jgi:TolB-like protein